MKTINGPRLKQCRRDYHNQEEISLPLDYYFGSSGMIIAIFSLIIVIIIIIMVFDFFKFIITTILQLVGTHRNRFLASS